MRMIRCYVDAPLGIGQRLRLPAEASQHLLRVLRLAVGDPVILFNGDGYDYPSVLTSAERSGADVEVLSVQELANESPLRIHLFQALARGDKMDWVLQKATELGVAAITPLITHRSEVKLSGERLEKRMRHWRGVVVAACEQSGRACVPSLKPLAAIAEACIRLESAQRWYLEPGANRNPGRLQINTDAEVVVVVGPEGGLDSRDIEALDGAGFQGLLLGPRVLRTETAGAAAISALQAIYGDLG